MSPEKLYVVVRDDLPAGDQACQALHAAVNFCMAYPGVAARWHDFSDFVVILSVADEDALRVWFAKVSAARRAVLVTEPDLDDQATAFCAEPGVRTGRLLSSLPLALRQPAMT